MADFTHPIFSWLIGIITIVGIVAILILTWKLSHRSKKGKDEKVKTMGHVWDENLEELNNPLPRWWLNLFYLTCIWGFGYLIFFPGLGAYEGVLKWSQTGQYDQEVEQANDQYGPIFEKFASQDIASLANNEEAITVGARLFSTYCTTCHGSDARGARGYPNLRDDDWLYGNSPEIIKTSIMEGRSGIMPPWGTIIGEKNIPSVTAYVEQLANRKVDANIAAEGKKHYDAFCVACHGAEGKGNQQIGAPNLTDDIWLHGGSTDKITESIALGRNGQMPPHAEFLGKDKVHILAAYVYSLSLEAKK